MVFMAHHSPKLLTECAAGIFREPLKGAMIVPVLPHVMTTLQLRRLMIK
jgi:hypothetical protein